MTYNHKYVHIQGVPPIMHQDLKKEKLRNSKKT